MPRFLTQPKIVGGAPAEYPIPWQVSVRKERTNAFHFCGGSILDQRTILTAAHCFDKIPSKDNLTGYSIMAGVTNKAKNYYSQVVDIQSVIMNEAKPFTRTHAENDVAILKLRSDLIFNEFVQPVCLTGEWFDPVGYTGIASGWGKLSSDEPATPDLLQWVRLDIQSHAQCQALWPKDIAYHAHICAGDPNGIENICNGDSGGPLVVPHYGKAVLVGVASFVSNKGCAYPTFPGVFARVSTYVRWIKNHMENYSHIKTWHK